VQGLTRLSQRTSWQDERFALDRAANRLLNTVDYQGDLSDDAQDEPMCRALARTVRSSLDAAFPDSPKLSSSCASCSTLPWPAT
jgi:hypothetical protein